MPDEPEVSTIRAGDIVVTRVARHYSIGRMNADRRTETPVDAAVRRTDALARACVLAGADHHVFLYESSGRCAAVKVDCADATKVNGSYSTATHDSRR